MPARIIPTSWIVAAAVFAAGLSMPGIVLGQEAPTTCVPVAEAMEALNGDGFSPIWRGLDERGVLTVVFQGPEERWLLAIISANGIVCRVGAGAGSYSDAPEPSGIES